LTTKTFSDRVEGVNQWAGDNVSKRNHREPGVVEAWYWRTFKWTCEGEGEIEYLSTL